MILIYSENPPFPDPRSLCVLATFLTFLCCRIILDKKYALPYRVVDAVVFHFLNFRSALKISEDPLLGFLFYQL